MPLERKAPGVIFRQPVNEPLQTGIKAIDAMIRWLVAVSASWLLAIARPVRLLLPIDTIINQKEFYDRGKPVFCIYVAIGQKASTVANVANTLEKAGALPYYRDCCGQRIRPCSDAVLCSVYGCCYRWIFPRYRWQHWLSMMTCRSKPYHTAKCHCYSKTSRVAKYIRAMYSICTHAVGARCKNHQRW